MITKDMIEGSWSYLLQQYELAETEEDLHRIVMTSKAVYERAAKEYGFRYADSLPKPTPRRAPGGSPKGK